MLMDYEAGRTLNSVDSGQVVEVRVQTKHEKVELNCYAAHKWNTLTTALK